MPVYMARFGTSDVVKIGYSTDIATRMAIISGPLWDDMIVLRAFEGTRKQEDYLHQRFAEHRIRYEWFRFHPTMMGDVGLREITLSPRGPITVARHCGTKAAFLSERSSELRDWMQSAHMDEVRLAKTLGVTTMSVCRWLSHGHRPRDAEARDRLNTLLASDPNLHCPALP